MVDMTKASKKVRKTYYSSHRVTNGFNTGIRTMATDKNPSRARQKMLDKKEIKCYN